MTPSFVGTANASREWTTAATASIPESKPMEWSATNERSATRRPGGSRPNAAQAANGKLYQQIVNVFYSLHFANSIQSDRVCVVCILSLTFFCFVPLHYSTVPRTAERYATWTTPGMEPAADARWLPAGSSWWPRTGTTAHAGRATRAARSPSRIDGWAAGTAGSCPARESGVL